MNPMQSEITRASTACCSARRLPLDAVSTGEARWIGVQRAGGAELPRVALIGVPGPST